MWYVICNLLQVGISFDISIFSLRSTRILLPWRVIVITGFRVELSRLHYHGYRLAFATYLCRKTQKNISCSVRGHLLHDLFSSRLSRIRASSARHLWHYFHLWPMVQALGCGRWVCVEFLHAATIRKGSGSTN